MSTKFSSFIDTQTNILEQEAFLTEWLLSLILWSETHHSPYKIPSRLNASTNNSLEYHPVFSNSDKPPEIGLTIRLQQ